MRYEKEYTYSFSLIKKVGIRIMIKDFQKVIKNNLLMIRYVRRFCPQHIIITVIQSILGSLLSILNILYVRYIIHEISVHSHINKVIMFIFVMLLINLVYSYISQIIIQQIFPKNIEILSENMQLEIFEKLKSLDYECYEDSKFFDKLSSAAQQSDQRALAVLESLSGVLGNFFSIGALLTIIGLLDPIVIIMVTFNVGINIIMNFEIISFQHDSYNEKILYRRESNYAQRLFYFPSVAKEIRMYINFSSLIKEKYMNAIDGLLKLHNKYSKKILSKTIKATSISVITDSIITLYLAIKVIYGYLNIADFVTMTSSASLLTQNITQFAMIFPKLYEHSIYIDNFNELINYEPKMKQRNNLTVIKEPIIEFKNVNFSYPKSKLNVLKKMNLRINYGEKIAFVGKNGAGKSTIIKLLCRLYECNSGNIELNGHLYDEYNLNILRSVFGIIFQEMQFFSYSIAENILMRPFANFDEDEKLVFDALKFVGLYEKVINLPMGIHTPLTREFQDNGVIFSGGEFQKLILARIYVSKCKILILDEPSSYLDAVAEKQIFDSVLKLSNNKTLILISHRLSNIQNVDRIYFVENGEIIESGKHCDLINLNGKYAELYKIQAEGYG